MFNKKKLAQGILAAVIGGNLFFPAITSAEIRTYEGVGEYIMSDYETPEVAKQRAKVYAERNAQEKAGVYVNSYSKVENLQLVSDEIVTITNGILKVLNVDYKIVPMVEYGGIMYRATVQANIDTDKVDEWIAKGVEERSSLVEKNRELQRQIDEQEKLITELKKQVSEKRSPQNEEKLKENFAEADRIFMSTVKLEEGNRLNLIIADWAYAEAVKCWTEAIELNPNNYLAYEARGYYFHLGHVARYNEAISDYTNAIKFNPSAENYFYRGESYLARDNIKAAQQDFETALEIAPNYSAPYGELAYIYATSGKRKNLQKAIDFANKAVTFDDRNWRAYYSRGLALFAMNEFESALADGQTALRWGCGDAYQLIGDCYGKLGLREEAEKYWELAKDPPAFG